jgi:hypothetical protein
MPYNTTPAVCALGQFSLLLHVTVLDLIEAVGYEKKFVIPQKNVKGFSLVFVDREMGKQQHRLDREK